MTRFLMALIIIAVGLQNTCPYGYAEKTAVAASRVHHCPLKDHQSSKPAGQNKMAKDFQDLNHPFVLASAPEADTGGTFDTIEQTELIKNKGFEDIFSDPPHKPPRSCPFLFEASV